MSTPDIGSVLDESITLKTVHAGPSRRWFPVLPAVVKWSLLVCASAALLYCWVVVLPERGAGAAPSDVTGRAAIVKVPPTRGEPWPKPQLQQKSNNFYTFDTSQLKVDVFAHTCHLLTRAINRYKDMWRVLNHHRSMLRLSYIHRHRNDTRRHRNETRRRRYTLPPPPPPDPRPGSYQGIMGTLTLHLTTPCDAEYPYYKMDESYSLTVSNSSKLKANSIWGLLRAFETFNQLLYYSNDYQELVLNDTKIYDFPRYPHRGLLLNTGRNHLPLDSLYRTLDAMAMNKMNVFHWHIVDDQSFPYVSGKLPKLSERGAFNETLVYSAADIRKLVDYAADLGIRVIPEFDIPGHTRSWGKAYPALLTKCYSGLNETGLGPLNPINPDVYKLLKELFEEVQELFPDKFFHIGGDDVDTTCWSSNPEVAEYLRRQIATSEDLHEQFVKQVMALLAVDVMPIVWQEVFRIMPLPYYTLVQIWKSEEVTLMLEQAIREGHEVLYSSEWHLDRANLSVGSVYSVDPRNLVAPNLAPRVAGGEACLWREGTNSSELLDRVWAHLSAVAEVLWSASLYSEKSPAPWWEQGEQDEESRAEEAEARRAAAAEEAEGHFERAAPRLHELACRMHRQGITAETALCDLPLQV